MKREFGKCLTHYLRTPDGKRPLYILPYEGNLTDRKFEQLAKRLMAKVGHYYPHATLSDYVPRLKSDWLTGREKYIHITPDDHGAFTITGENFWLYGWAAGDFVVLEQAPEPIACKA